MGCWVRGGWGVDGVGYGWGGVWMGVGDGVVRQCGVGWGEVGWSESQKKNARASPLEYHLSEAVDVK
jgi:hypothetical protein